MLIFKQTKFEFNRIMQVVKHNLYVLASLNKIKNLNILLSYACFLI